MVFDYFLLFSFIHFIHSPWSSAVVNMSITIVQYYTRCMYRLWVWQDHNLLLWCHFMKSELQHVIMWFYQCADRPIIWQSSVSVTSDEWNSVYTEQQQMEIWKVCETTGTTDWRLSHSSVMLEIMSEHTLTTQTSSSALCFYMKCFYKVEHLNKHHMRRRQKQLSNSYLTQNHVPSANMEMFCSQPTSTQMFWLQFGEFSCDQCVLCKQPSVTWPPHLQILPIRFNTDGRLWVSVFFWDWTDEALWAKNSTSTRSWQIKPNADRSNMILTDPCWSFRLQPKQWWGLYTACEGYFALFE